jgi:hypothetical protein
LGSLETAVAKFDFPPTTFTKPASSVEPVAPTVQGLKIYLDGFDDLRVKERELQIPAPVERLCIGELKDKLETFYAIPRIFIDLQSGNWMCSGQRLEISCPFKADFLPMLEVDPENFVKVTVIESSARRWALELEKSKQRASLVEKQLFALQTKLEEEKIKATESMNEMRKRIDSLGQQPASGSDDRDDLIEQTNLLKLSLNAARESAQSRIRLLEADLLSANSAHELAIKDLKEQHVQELAEMRRAHVHQTETLTRSHQSKLDEQKEAAAKLEDEIVRMQQKYELFRTAKATEIGALNDRIHELEALKSKQIKEKSEGEAQPAAAATTAAASPSAAPAGAGSEDVAKLTKKVQKLSEEIEEKEEELHAKQQLLRRVRFLVDQMSCIAEQKKK